MLVLVLWLAAGVLCAGVGGELFVRGAVGVAKWARIPAGIIGATVAAFATSSPELAVAVSAALAGEPKLAVGDALGSNVANIALIFAVALLLGGRVQPPSGGFRRDFAGALLAPLLVGLLALDGRLSRLDAAALLLVFVGWLAATVAEARRERSAAPAVLGEREGWKSMAFTAAGLGLLIAAGRLIVLGAKGIALAAGLDELVVGATVVAIATSSPELATTLVARRRGHDEVGVGTLLGSNIFNTLFIIGVANAITPATVAWQAVLTGALFGVLVVAAALPRGGGIPRGRGYILLALYAAFIAAVLQTG